MPTRNVKTDVSDLSLKVAVRQWVIDRIRPASVLDLYCGRYGYMYQDVWYQASEYLGTDNNEPHDLAHTLKMSAERAVQDMDLDTFNIYDVDPYNSPWIVARRILRRRASGQFGLVLTSGEWRGLYGSHANEVIRATLGLTTISNLSLFCRQYETIMLLMVRSLVEMPGVTLDAGVYGMHDIGNPIWYGALLLTKA